MCFDVVSRMNEARDPRCFFFGGGGGGYLCSNEETNSGLTDGILTQTPAMPVQCYQLRFQANWELLVMWVD